MEAPKLKYTKTKGRIKILKVLPYKGCPVYIRQVDETLFEYILIFNENVYSSYIVVTLAKGKTKLTLKQVNGAAGLIFAGAVTTIDELIKMRQDTISTSPINPAELKGGKGLPN